MKRTWMAFCTAVLLLAGLTAFSQAPTPASASKNVGFEKLKALVGSWEGTAGDGKAATVTYRLVSNGSALEETLIVGGEETMVTMYHLDGRRIVMTHFCAAGNQPRMRAAGLSPDGKKISFSFLDVTNLSNSTAGHMHALEVTFVDAGHITQQWTWLENGKDEKKELFKLTRKG